MDFGQHTPILALKDLEIEASSALTPQALGRLQRRMQKFEPIGQSYPISLYLQAPGLSLLPHFSLRARMSDGQPKLTLKQIDLAAMAQWQQAAAEVGFAGRIVPLRTERELKFAGNDLGDLQQVAASLRTIDPVAAGLLLAADPVPAWAAATLVARQKFALTMPAGATKPVRDYVRYGVRFLVYLERVRAVALPPIMRPADFFALTQPKPDNSKDAKNMWRQVKQQMLGHKDLRLLEYEVDAATTGVLSDPDLVRACMALEAWLANIMRHDFINAASKSALAHGLASSLRPDFASRMALIP